jgi:hypothetical protein
LRRLRGEAAEILPVHPEHVERCVVEVSPPGHEVPEVLPTLVIQGDNFAVEDDLFHR